MKQIIVMRTDLNMRKGKMIAQGAHASMGAVLPYLGSLSAYEDRYTFDPAYMRGRDKVADWLAGSFTKICVRADSEEQLREIYEKATAAGLITCLITDAGKTEFTEPTVTCCAIGPDTDENLDPITGELKLL